MKPIVKLTVIVAVFMLLATAASPSDEQKMPKGLAELVALSESFEVLSEQTSPAVVQVLVTGFGEIDEFGRGGEGLLPEIRTGGSGVIIDSAGYIITNAHVIRGARRIQILLSEPENETSQWRSILKPKNQLLGAQVVGVDAETDLALLRVFRTGLPFLTLGNSDDLQKGELVFAYGAPLGLENSVSMGVISAVARQLRPEDPMIYIQTDAPINPGSSGGPLVNARGEVVGINTLIFSLSGGSQGIGFAAPSNIVRNVYEQLRSTGRVRRGLIGVNAQTITPPLAKGLGLPRDWGVVLGDVYPGGPAYQAGLMIGDVVLSLNRKRMENARQFDVNLYHHRIGDRVTLRVLRGADTMIVNVSVKERDEDDARFVELVNPEEHLVEPLKILAVELDRELLQLLPKLRRETGVLVAARAGGGSLFSEGLKPGDVVYALNGRPIGGLSSMRRTVSKLSPDDPLVLQIERNGKLMFVTIEID